jgi:CBS domain-containing protein
MLAKDIMKKKVITASPDMTVRELARLLVDKGISGAPVVDADWRLVGVVSQTDIVRCDCSREAKAENPSYYSEAEKMAFQDNFQIEAPDFTRVSEVMTPVVISFEENAPVELIAKKMLDRGIHRVIITRGGKLCGIVSSMDMLRALLAINEEARSVAEL